MLKIEYIWRDLLYRAIELQKGTFTITELSNRYSLSSSMVSHALLPLRDLNIVGIGKKTSRILDTEKLLYFWATRRNLKKDIVYQTYSPLPVKDRETLMPSVVIPTAFSACRLLYSIIPSDYDCIYFYSHALSEIESRFPLNKKQAVNIVVIKPDPFLPAYPKIPLAQVFVDLWNIPYWYANEYLEAVKLKIITKIGL